jgi:hypothetical protein
MGAINAIAWIHTEASVEANMLCRIIYSIMCKKYSKQTRNNIFKHPSPLLFKSCISKVWISKRSTRNKPWIIQANQKQYICTPLPPSFQIRKNIFKHPPHPSPYKEMQFINLGSPKYMTEQVGRSIPHRRPKCMTKFRGGPDEISGWS